LTATVCLTYKPRTPSADLTALRSLLFVPGNDAHKLVRAAQSGADAVIADLEDAVPVAAKADARALVAQSLAAPAAAEGAPARSRPLRLVRVNAADTAYFADDVALLQEAHPDGAVLPKASAAAAAMFAATGLPVLAIVETASGVREAFTIAQADNVFALLLGALDLSVELGLESRPDGLELQYARSKLVVDSAAAGVRPPFDSVHVGVRDAEGLRAQAELARSLGMAGKACIHPAQVEIVNHVFSPDAEQVAWARRVIAAAESAEQQGVGAIALDGAMVDAPVLARARRIVSDSERSHTS
jgi:citrate lyase beta subunit